VISTRSQNLYELFNRVVAQRNPVWLTSEVALPNVGRDRPHGVCVQAHRVTIGEGTTGRRSRLLTSLLSAEFGSDSVVFASFQLELGRSFQLGAEHKNAETRKIGAMLV
jgi:hypothetical protein